MANETKTRIVKKNFVVKESKFSSGVKSRWRFPRGKHSKVRQMHKGRPALPSPGFGSSKSSYGLHSSGLFPIVVKNKEELQSINKETQGVLLSANLGKRKRVEVLEVAQGLGLKLLNVKDVTKYLSSIKEEMVRRKKSKVDNSSKKAKKAEDNKKKAKKKEDESKKPDEDNKADLSKKVKALENQVETEIEKKQSGSEDKVPTTDVKPLADKVAEINSEESKEESTDKKVARLVQQTRSNE